MKGHRMVRIAVLVSCLGAPVAAQQPPAQPSDHLAALKASLQKSMAELHQYQWVETTVISMKGEEKSRTENSCYYGADGTLQKTPIGGEPESQGKAPRGIRGRVVENKKEEVSDSTKEAVALVKQYVPPDPSRIQSAKEAGNLSVVPPNAEGNLQLVIKNYLKAGDSLTVDMNATVDRLTGLSVSTYTDEKKDKVDLEVAFGVFPDGTVYAKTINLNVKSEELAVEITNSGYKKMGS